VYLGNVGYTQKQGPHLRGTIEKAEIYTKVCFTQDEKSCVTKELWEFRIRD